MGETFSGRLRRRVEAMQGAGLARSLRTLVPTGPVTANWQGRSVLVFSSNDYLGLAQHPDVLAAWTGAGCGSSRLIAGSRRAHLELEEDLEERFGAPALVCSSGYQANLAVLSTLFEEGDTVASDGLNHASIIDGLRLGRFERTVLPHGTVPPPGCSGGVVEGLYSMDGDTVDLQGWRARVEVLVVDEAHAIGCLGPGGRGAAADQGVTPDVVVGTFGKALGAAGAFVVGSAALKELLISQGRAFVYTTALAEPAARAARVGLRLATRERQQLLDSAVGRFRSGLADLGLECAGHHHIVPLVLGTRTMAVAAALLESGIYVPGIRWPTVPRGQERLRFSLSAAHTPDQIDRVLDALDTALRTVSERNG